MGKHSGDSHSSKRPIHQVDHRPIRETPDSGARAGHHDAYRSHTKSSDATVCPDCGLSSFGGKWSWSAPPLADVHEAVCPACQRIRDDYPAGWIELHGLSANEREEVQNLIRNVEEREKAEHPLERLMSMRQEGEAMIATTTGMHLGRAIAGALGRRFRDRVTVEYPPGESRIRVRLRA